MEKEEERQWAESQKIAVSIDLVSAAKNQLKFLAAVDRNRYLYEGPLLEWAIYRYNAYWLPLLAKHLENPVSEKPLVVPLDCEWIWHCHRLNPVRYKSDCEKLFGRILGTHNVVSSVKGTSKSKTEEVWNIMYPEEPYELDHNRDISQKKVQSENFTSYDLVSAVKRQVSFCYQVSRPHMCDDLYLQEALARYKGFLHLIRTNMKKGLKRFCVPTYDVDLMWHSHQLHPVSYCNDLKKLVGKVLQHDDTDSDRTKGNKLDTGFTVTTKQWKEAFGSSYWKAGAMYRGTSPTPVTHIPHPFVYEGKKFHVPESFHNLIQLPEKKAMEVVLEFLEIKNMPEAHKGNLRVSFCKKQPDKLISAKKTSTKLPELEEKQVAYFQCESNGELLFELLRHFPSNIESSKLLGSCSLSFQECLASGSKLSVDKWLPVVPVTGILASKPILLHVSLSFTPPTPTARVFHLHQPFFKGSCFLPLPKAGKVNNAKGQTFVIDDEGNDILSLQMRDVISKNSARSIPDLLKEVLYITDSGETHTLAEFHENEWVIKGSHGSFKLCCTSGNDDYVYELVGHKMVRLFAGRKLDYEPKHWENPRSEHDFMTAVEFSAEYPYGRAVALFDFKHGIFKVTDEWMILTGITLAFILSDILRSEGRFTAKVGCEDRISNQVTNSPSPVTAVQVAMTNNDAWNLKQGLSKSGSGCENAVESGSNCWGCGSECGRGIDSGGNCWGCGSECGRGIDSGGNCWGCGSECGRGIDNGGLCGGGYCGGNCGGGGCLTAKVTQVVVANNDAVIAKQGLSQSASCWCCSGGCDKAVEGGSFGGGRCFTATDSGGGTNVEMAKCSGAGCSGRCGNMAQ